MREGLEGRWRSGGAGMPSCVVILICTVAALAVGFTLPHKEGQSFQARVDAPDDPRGDTPGLLPPVELTNEAGLATGRGAGAAREIGEWQAIMNDLRKLAVNCRGELLVISVDARAAEVLAAIGSRT